MGGEDRSESVLNAIQIHLQGWGCGLSKKQTVVEVVRVVAIQIHLQGWGLGLSKKQMVVGVVRVVAIQIQL